jgi:4-hydroxy-3-methylbut-2-enyl diphosphate reductase
MKTTIDCRIKLAPVFGMDVDARSAMWQLEEIARTETVGVAGRFMPDPGISRHMKAINVVEDVQEEDFFRFARIVIPYTGVAPPMKKKWEQEEIRLMDLTSRQVKRAQVALSLLRMEGGQPLVIGRHGDAESRVIADGNPGCLILEDTTDTARLSFSPAFVAVCQTRLSPRKVSWLVQQLRHRYRDAKVNFLDTLSPAMAARERALEPLLSQADRVIIVGEPGEASCEALAESALRNGKPSEIIAGPEAVREPGRGRIVLTAGAFALDSTIRNVADALLGKA